MAKIINYEKLREAKELLREVYLENNDGEENDIKFITFELFNANQAKKKKISEDEVFLETKTKYNKDLHSIKTNIIIEELKNERL